MVTRGAQEAHAADASSFAEVEASVMISVYLLFLVFFFIGLSPNLQLDGLAGLDEQKARGDARHSLGGFGAAALDPVGDDP